MKFLQKKETNVQNIAFISIMCALNVLATLVIGNFLIIGIFLIIFLPLTSTLTSYFCQKKYVFIYVISTILLSLLISFNYIETTLFYVIPSIAVGILFTVFLKLKISGSISLLFCALAQTSLNLLIFFLLKFLAEIDVLNALSNAINSLLEIDLKNYIFSIIFVVSLIQNILSFISLTSELKKVNISYQNFLPSSQNNALFLALSICIGIAFSFIYFPISIFGITVAFYFTILGIANCILGKRKSTFVILILSIFASILIGALLYSKIPEKYSNLTLLILPLLTLVVSFFDTLLKKKA